MKKLLVYMFLLTSIAFSQKSGIRTSDLPSSLMGDSTLFMALDDSASKFVNRKIVYVDLYSNFNNFNQENAFKGNLFVTYTGVVDGTGWGYNTITHGYDLPYFTTLTNAAASPQVSPFSVGDILLDQKMNEGVTYSSPGVINNNQYLLKRIFAVVDSINGLAVYWHLLPGAASQVGSIAKGDRIITIGNTSLSSGRNSFIQMGNNGLSSPFIAIKDSIYNYSSYASLKTLKAFLGNLTDLSINGMSGYGFFANNTFIGDTNSYIKFHNGSLNIKGTFNVISPSLTNKINTITQMLSLHGTSITQNSDSLAFLAYDYQHFVGIANNRYSSDSATLVLHANQITSKVSSTDFTGANIASLINQTSHAINMSALNINLNGLVTFSSFDGTTQSLINE